MKKIKFLLLIAVVSLSSCDDAIDIAQDGEITDAKTFTSTSQMNLFLNETYDRLMGSTNASNEIGLSSILTDEVGIGRGSSPTDIYRFTVNTNNTYSTQIWIDYYTVINYCNRLIRGSALVVPTSSNDQIVYNDILAQTLSLRAYSYMQLLTYFSTDLKNNSALGVILLDRVPTVTERLPRKTNGEVFALIESDLNYAAANIQPTTAASKPWAYVSKSMINALRARMYAYRGNYMLAETYADLVIGTSGLTLTDGTLYNPLTFYTTTSSSEYKKMFQDNIRGEIIWSIGRALGKTTIGSVYNVNGSNLAGISTFEMNRNLFNILDNNGAPWDIRRWTNIDPTSVVDMNYMTSTSYNFTDVLVVDKYSGITGNALTNDIKVFRLSEMYLIKAEARAYATDLPGVATILKTIRDKRSYTGARPLPLYSNTTLAWADILKERRVELCFEGHRYIDLKRLGALANVGIDRNPLDCSSYSLPICSINLDDFRFTLPIPLNEVSGNPQIQQNPGY